MRESSRIVVGMRIGQALLGVGLVGIGALLFHLGATHGDTLQVRGVALPTPSAHVLGSLFVLAGALVAIAASRVPRCATCDVVLGKGDLHLPSRLHASVERALSENHPGAVAAVGPVPDGGDFVSLDLRYCRECRAVAEARCGKGHWFTLYGPDVAKLIGALERR